MKKPLVFVVWLACGSSSSTVDSRPPRSDGPESPDAQLVFDAPAAPRINSFVATPITIGAGGGDVTLSWSVTGATSVSIAPEPGVVTGSSVVVNTSASTTNTLTARSDHGTVTETDSVEVTTIGELMWTNLIGGANYEWDPALACDGAGATYLVGGTQSALFGANAGQSDAFVAKLDATGSVVWSTQFGTAEVDSADDVLIDSTGHVVIAGRYGGALPGQTNIGVQAAFVAKYTAAGALVWARQFGTPSADFNVELAADPTGALYVVAQTEGTLAGQTSAGFYDVIVAKYDSSGSLLWSRQLGTSSDDDNPSVAADATGVYVEGFRFVAKLNSSTGATAWQVTPPISPRNIALVGGNPLLVGLVASVH